MPLPSSAWAPSPYSLWARARRYAVERNAFARLLFSRARGRAFGGRVLFDHLEKTAGQAINAWLRGELGGGCVTPNMGAEHRAAIAQFGGLYSVIFGHIRFSHGESLDPRYDYVTLLREPIDRAASWTYFLANTAQVEGASATKLALGAQRFLQTDGREANAQFLESLRNPYVEHFSRINPGFRYSDAQALLAAQEALDQYRVVGFYEDLPRFTSAVAALLEIAAPVRLLKINPTNERPNVDALPSGVRTRIAQMTALDRSLYDWARGHPRILASTTRSVAAMIRGAAYWVRYAGPPARNASNPSATVRLQRPAPEPAPVERFAPRGDIAIALDVDLFEPVRDLVVAVQVLDASARLAFGVDSRQLACSFRELGTGKWRLTVTLEADLAEGPYTFGIALQDHAADGVMRTLAWHDRIGRFEIASTPSDRFSGYRELAAKIELARAA
jgi:hypothetical protein